VERLADFFGTTCYIIENENIEEIEILDRTTAVHGNKNPSAVPIIDENELTKTIYKTIGELIITHPITYFFQNETNIIGVKVGNQLSDIFSINSILIIKRFSAPKSNELMLTLTNTQQLAIRRHRDDIHYTDKIIGIVLEERLIDE